MSLAALGAAAVAVTTIGLPSVAQAQTAVGTARINGDVVAFQGAPGQVNEMSVLQVGGDIYFADAQPINAGSGCWYPYEGDDTVVACDDAPGGVHIRLGDRSDLLYLDVPGGDTVWGQAGHDTIEATGWDTVYGEGGNDSLYTARYQYGGDGIDWLIGSGRFNRLEGGRGSDNLFGEDGTDSIAGGPGHDYLSGGMGYDKLYGGDGEDLMFGDRGDDKMWGNANSDSLYGGSGSDLLRGGPATDYLHGGPGADRQYQS